MEINNHDGRAKILAYYLPQFEPNELNNKYYGEGFTEWTNVGKAKSLFHGHSQPKVPADLGYYDLRVPEVAVKQAKLAQEAGVFGFAYWHYWWAGNMELHKPAERMLKNPDLDFPFCFAWANENWYKKLWSKDKGKDILLKEQTYPGEEDNRKHFEYCLPFFKDKRYLTFDGRPIFYIYNPLQFPKVNEFICQWNNWIKEMGIAPSFYFVGLMRFNRDYETIIKQGFDCVTPQQDARIGNDISSFTNHVRVKLNSLVHRYFGVLRKQDYRKFLKYGFDNEYDSKETVAPQLIPNWDNTPRASHRGIVYTHCNPNIWKQVATLVLSGVKQKNNKLVFLKSWNEWAEGNYMEPDLEYGKGNIKALGAAIEETREIINE